MSKIHSTVLGDGLPEINVLIAYIDEPQLVESITNINTYCQENNFSVAVKIHSGFRNFEVHELIYQEVNGSNIPCVKLDADMIIEDIDCLFKMIKNIRDDYIAILPLYCYIVGVKIYGVHVFGRSVVGLHAHNKLFPDKYDYQNVSIYELKSISYISHCKNPNKDQIINFVGHRLRKFFRSNFMSPGHLKMAIRGLVNNRTSICEVAKILNLVFALEYKYNSNQPLKDSLPSEIEQLFHR